MSNANRSTLIYHQLRELDECESDSDESLSPNSTLQQLHLASCDAPRVAIFFELVVDAQSVAVLASKEAQDYHARQLQRDCS